MAETERPFPPPHLTPEQNLRKEAFIVALQAMSFAGINAETVDEVVAEADRFYDWLNK